MIRSLAVLLVPFLLFAAAAAARDVKWGGLQAVASSPDGQTIAVGGASRTLYLLDGRTLEVTRRIWIGAQVGSVFFTRDGSRLVLEDEDEVVHFLDTKTWQVVGRIEDHGQVSPAAAAGRMAAADRRGRTIRILSTADGAAEGKIELAEGIEAAIFCLDPAGERLAVLTRGADGDEEKVGRSDIPKDLTGLDRKAFEQEHDGRVSRFLVFDLASGEATVDAEVWFSTSNPTAMVARGDEFVVLSFDNRNAVFDLEGGCRLVDLEHSFNYGAGAAGDGSYVYGGSLRDGTRLDLGKGESVAFKIDRLPGWPEYFAGFEVRTDGSALGVTSAFRLVVFDAAGKPVRVVPVY